DIAVVDGRVAAAHAFAERYAVGLGKGGVAFDLAAEVANEMLATADILPLPGDAPLGEIAAEALEHAVIVDGVLVVDGAQQLDIAAIDAATIAGKYLVNLVAAEQFVEPPIPVLHIASAIQSANPD